MHKIEDLKEWNKRFEANNHNGIQNNKENYEFHQGKKQVIISAPHAVRQVREGRDKEADFLTGPLAMYIAKKSNCSYLVRVYNNEDDPNFPIGKTLEEIENAYLKFLIDYIKANPEYLVIDLHGCKDSRPYDCSIGSHHFKTCEKEIIDIFSSCLRKYGLSVDEDSQIFSGGQVTRQVGKTNSNAIQLEIRREYRTFKNTENLNNLVEAISEGIDQLDKAKTLYKKMKM